MKTIAFYSYKGGVGRTLAVAHFAYWLGKQGQSVFLLDMDLEAPGLHYKIVRYTQPVQPHQGLVDYIGHFQQESKAADSLDPYVIRLVSRDVGMPPLWLMPAGNPLNPTYWSQLSKVDWKEFLYGEQKWGTLLFLELKAQIEATYQPHFLLIDSRTGLTDLTGIGLELLADHAIVLGVNNPENIDGARLVMERLRRREKLPFRQEKAQLHFVLARIPVPERPADLEREHKLREAVMQKLNSDSGIASGPLVTRVNVIHIDPGQAWEERIRFMEKEKEWGQYPILKDYQDLVFEVTGLGKSGEEKSFWAVYEDYLLEQDAGKKQELAVRLVGMETQVAEEAFLRGYIAQEALKDIPQAIAAYTQAIGLRPDDAMTYNNRGIAYADQKQYELALADYTKAIELNPGYAEAYYNRGTVYYELQQYGLALADHTKAIELNPDDADTYYNRGYVYDELQQYELALADYTKAIELNPGYADAYNNRGNVYDELQQYELALTDHTKAIELNPDDADAYNNLAVTYYHLGDFAQGLSHAEHALELNPQDATTCGTLADIHAALGHTQQFYDFLEKALALNPREINRLDPETLSQYQHEERFQALAAKYQAE